MNRIKESIALLTMLAAAPASAAPAPANSAGATSTAPGLGGPRSQDEVRERFRRISESLTPQTGNISIPEANAVLHLGEDYYFLPPAQARTVLVDAWGNPPESTRDVLGIVFPAGKTFLDDTWGAVITFQPTGYVSDEDAESIDYAALLQQMREAEPAINARRVAAGYPAQHFMGWAQTPSYDRASHSVVWAQNIQIEGDPENSLNYDIRLLGRHGVLSLNMVTVISKLGETREAASRFAAAAEFRQGARYADFQPGDRTAEYGVAGLVATGVGVAAAQKAGLLAVILIALKKFGIFIIAGLAALFAAIRGSLRRREEESFARETGYDTDYADHSDEPDAPEAPVSLEKA